jgi:hypothetical protein
LEAWLFLKYTAKIGLTPLTGFPKSLDEIKTILDKPFYKQGDSKAGYTADDIEKTFIDYFKDGQSPVLTVAALAEASDALGFMDILANANTTKTLTTLFPANSPLLVTNLTDKKLLFEKNRTVLAEAKTQKKMVTVIYDFSKDATQIPVNTVGLVDPKTIQNKSVNGDDLEILKQAFLDLQTDLIGGVKTVKGARYKITNKINKSMGEKMTYNQLLRLTASGMVFEAPATKGSLFEHWAFQKLNADTTQLGYKLYRKNPDAIDKIEDGIVVDFYYTLPNGNIVAVEMKHAIDVPNSQLKDRKALLADKSKSIAGFIYIFTVRPAIQIKNKINTELPGTSFFYFSQGVLTPF